MWNREINWTHVCVSPSSSNKQFPSDRLQQLLFTSLHTFLNSFALIFTDNFSPFLSRLMFQKWGFEYNYTRLCISCNTNLIKRAYWWLKSVTSNLDFQHCQSVLSWQVIQLDTLPSAFRLRSLQKEVLAVYPSLGSYPIFKLNKIPFHLFGITPSKCTPYFQKNLKNFSSSTYLELGVPFVPLFCENFFKKIYPSTYMDWESCFEGVFFIINFQEFTYPSTC